MHVERNCENCGQSFQIRRERESARRYCSRDCMLRFETANGRQAARKTPVQFTCRECGKPFEMMQSYVTAYRKKFNKEPTYCSRPCSALGRRKDAEMRLTFTCIQCGETLPVRRQPGGTINRSQRLCSTECRSLFRRLSYQTKNPAQKITRRIAKHGYIRIIVPGIEGQPSRDLLEHRYNMEQSLGRALYPNETVHHINGIRSDNRLENLELFSSRHGPGQRVTDKVTFAIEILTLYPEFCRAAGYELTKHS